MSIEMFIQHLCNATTLGSLYALTAIGYTMVYGILRLINFAHGDIFMLGAYFVFFGGSLFALPWGLAVIGAILLSTACGIMVDRVAYRPLRDAPRISALISSIGVSFLIENLAIVIFTAIPRPVEQPEWLSQVFLVGGVRILSLTLVVPAISFLLVAGLLWIVYKTKPGLAMRAYSLAEASVLAPFEYVALPISIMWGFLIWHEVPTLMTLAGAALTLASGLYIFYRARK